MKNFTLRFSLLALICLPLSLFAHEGEHPAPGSMTAKIAGAQIQANENTALEVVYAAKTIKVYPFTREQTPQDPKNVKISATIELPRKKAEPATLVTQGEHWVINFDPKSAHRFTLILKMEDGSGDTFKYTIEPKK